MTFPTTAEQRQADGEARVAEWNAHQQAEHARLTGTPATRAEGLAIAAAFDDWVARLPRVALGDAHLADAAVFSLRACVETTPLADTSKPYISKRSHYALRTAP